MEVAWYRCNIHYYLREKYYGKVQNITKKATKVYLDSTEFIFYNGISHILEGQSQKGIVDLMPLQSDKELHLGVTIALIFAHKAAGTDKEALYSLENKLKEERKHGGTMSYYYAGLFLSLAEKYEKASDYISKALKKDSNNLNAILLKGWNDLYMNFTELKTSILDCFELALSKSDKNIEALLGLAIFKYFCKDHDTSNLTLDRLIVNNPDQVVPLIEKLKNEFAMQKWEPVSDTLERIFMLDPKNIEALRIRIFMAISKNADYIEAADQLNKFYTVLENEETYNGYQFYITAQTFSKLCGRSNTVLSQVYRFAQYASEMYPHNVNYLSEVGYQCILQGKAKDAVSFFKAASKIDSNSITALCGLTLCQMTENGPTEQISQQVELLFEMQGTNKLPILYLLSAQLNYKKPVNAISYLNEASETKINYTNMYPYSLDYVNKLDPDFLLDVYKEYKRHLPKRPFIIFGYLTYTVDDGNNTLSSCIQVLETICSVCPGLISALYELAKLKFLFGYANESLKLAQQIIELDNTHTGSQILLAQIYVQQQSFVKAAQCLEVCLSYNFKIRDNAMYHFLNGVILKNYNRLQEAQSSFVTSLNIVTNKSNANRSNDSDLNIIDKATLYLLIIEAHTSLDQHGDAGKVMQVFFIHCTYFMSI